MRATAALALVASCAACSARTVVNSHGAASGELTFATSGLTYPLDSVTALSFDVGVDRRTTLLEAELLFEGLGYAFFTLVVKSGLTITGQPSIGAPFSYVAEYPDRAQGLRARLELIGELRAANVYLVCDEDDVSCAVGTRNGRLILRTATTSATRVEGTLDFSTDPKVEDAP